MTAEVAADLQVMYNVGYRPDAGKLVFGYPTEQKLSSDKRW